ncbi:hypothetical protein D3C86_1637290 [compost metagenome]
MDAIPPDRFGDAHANVPMLSAGDPEIPILVAHMGRKPACILPSLFSEQRCRRNEVEAKQGLEAIGWMRHEVRSIAEVLLIRIGDRYSGVRLEHRYASIQEAGRDLVVGIQT